MPSTVERWKLGRKGWTTNEKEKVLRKNIMKTGTVMAYLTD